MILHPNNCIDIVQDVTYTSFTYLTKVSNPPRRIRTQQGCEFGSHLGMPLNMPVHSHQHHPNGKALAEPLIGILHMSHMQILLAYS